MTESFREQAEVVDHEEPPLRVAGGELLSALYNATHGIGSEGIEVHLNGDAFNNLIQSFRHGLGGTPKILDAEAFSKAWTQRMVRMQTSWGEITFREFNAVEGAT